PAPVSAGAFKTLKRNMLQLDSPDHTRLLLLVNLAFTPRLVEQLRGRIQRLTDGVLDTTASRGTADRFRDFALPPRVEKLLPGGFVAGRGAVEQQVGIQTEGRHRLYP